MGRPTKLNAKLQERLLSFIRLGSYYAPACAAVGVSYDAFNDWCRKGEQATNGIYRQFVQALKKAEAEAEMNAIGTIRKAMQKEQHWTAAMTFLERRFRDRWGRTEHHDIDLQTSVTDADATTKFDSILNDIIQKRNSEDAKR